MQKFVKIKIVYRKKKFPSRPAHTPQKTNTNISELMYEFLQQPIPFDF